MFFIQNWVSIKQKVERITALAKFISVWVPSAPIIEIEKAAYLIKADLATSAVREFPELQGIIGNYYAQYVDEDQEIANAIREHYYPVNADAICTKNPISITLSIADKVDTIVGMIAAGEKCSSSRDPFALRRAALGIIRTIIDNNIMLPLDLIIEKSAKIYPASCFKKKKILPLNKDDMGEKLPKKTVVEIAIKFCNDRLKYFVKEQGISENIINSVINNTPNIAYSYSIYLNKFLITEKGEELLAVYKRLKNILSSAEKDKKAVISKRYQKTLFIEEIEITVADQLKKVKPKIKLVMKDYNIETSLDILISLVIPINQFIDNVLINHDNKDIRNNRLRILAYMRFLFIQVADFNLL